MNTDTSRIVALSDGVIAVVITVLVLEFKVPAGHQLVDLQPLLPVFLAYVLSFRQVATYWVNHHHLLKLARKANGRLMWANLRLLFVISLLPFVTAWLGEHYDQAVPVALYGLVTLAAGVAYNRVQAAVLAEYPPEAVQRTRFGRDIKGKLSLLSYATAIGLAFVSPWLSLGLYVAVAVVWSIPERRVEELIK